MKGLLRRVPGGVRVRRGLLAAAAMLLTGGVGAALQGGPPPAIPAPVVDGTAAAVPAVAAEIDRFSRRLLDEVARHEDGRRRRHEAEAAEIRAFGERLAALRPLVEVRLPAAEPPVPPLLWQESCRRRLVALAVGFTSVGDARNARGCGLADAVRVERLGRVRLSRPAALTCDMAERLGLYVRDVLQPAARRQFGRPVTGIDHLGTYACRTIAGAGDTLSQHAFANAIDIAGVTLADGREIRVGRDWRGDGPAAHFLRQATAGACPLFSVTLTPEADARHADHFHLDAGPARACR